MSIDVAIVDYGIGNIFSVRHAFKHWNAKVTVSHDPGVLLSAKRLVLPGVGAFADGMKGLKEKNLDEVVREYAASRRPLLGICLGMQMLASVSEEFGEHVGLGIIPGRVIPIPATKLDGSAHKIPHIGWTGLRYPDGVSTWESSILEDLSAGDSVYLVHSFAVSPDNPEHRLADCFYHGRIISAAIRDEHVYGTQFHPEKSGVFGLNVLKRFLEISA